MRSLVAFGLPLTVTLLGALAACEDSSTSGSPTTFDAAATPFEAGTPGDTSTAADTSTVTPGECTEPDYVNGVIPSPPNGQLNFHIENLIDAVIVRGTGTAPCQAKFEANAGVMVGGAMSGAYDIQCGGTDGDQYFGFHIHGLGKIGAAGTEYKIGKSGLAGAALNDEVDFTWESGSRCGAKAATLREWQGAQSIAGRGIFAVEDVTGSDVRFSISPTDMKVSSKNVAGKGTFTLNVGTIAAAPLTIVGL